jgi:peptide/nickel transport system substrate-binding protein
VIATIRTFARLTRRRRRLPQITRFGRTIGAVVLAALLLAASGGTRGTQSGGTLRVGIAGDQFDSVDAAITASPATLTIVRATCAGLMQSPDKPFPEGLTFVPELAAKGPRITDGGRTYTFTMRRGLRFSTGAAVTARDVVHTINRLLNPVMKAYAANLLIEIVGAREVLAGRAQTARGVVARGNTVTIRLTRPVGDFVARMALGACVVPQSLAPDAEGAKPPIPTAGPYYVAEYVPGRSVVLERNRFYRGARPHRVDRIEVDLTGANPSILDRVDRGELDYGWATTSAFADRANEFRRKYGLNRSRFFAVPAGFLRLFVLNTSRPLFRNNPALREAVNFAIDRRALLRERGPFAGVLTDQYLPPSLPGFRDERIYPLEEPNVARARELARGNLRGRRATLYTIAIPLGLAQAQIVKANLARIGLDVRIEQHPGSLYFERVEEPGAPFDIAWAGWLADVPDPSVLNDLFHGRNIPEPNLSRFDSPTFNRRLDNASRLTGPARYREYAQLDVDLARDAAPAIAYAYDTALTLVSDRVGCVVVNPYLDLAAACLK